MLVTSGERLSSKPERVGGSVREFYDGQPACQWDTVILPPSQSTPDRIKLFQIPRGKPDPYLGREKNEVDTSMFRSRCLVPPFCLQMHSIMFSIFPMVEAFIHEYTWRFVLDNKHMWKGPLINLHFDSAKRLTLFLDQPQFIAPTQQFDVELLGTPVRLDTQLSILCCLDGVHDRPIC